MHRASAHSPGVAGNDQLLTLLPITNIALIVQDIPLLTQLIDQFKDRLIIMYVHVRMYMLLLNSYFVHQFKDRLCSYEHATNIHILSVYALINE